MTFRRAAASDSNTIAKILGSSDSVRLGEIVSEAIKVSGNEYIAAVSGNPPDVVAAYGMVAGTMATASLYGVVPISSRVTELLSFVAHDLQKLGAKQIVAEFPDTDEFKPYRDVLLESGYDPTGLVEDFYRDGVAMVIFTRTLRA